LLDSLLQELKAWLEKCVEKIGIIQSGSAKGQRKKVWPPQKSCVTEKKEVEL